MVGMAALATALAGCGSTNGSTPHEASVKSAVTSVAAAVTGNAPKPHVDQAPGSAAPSGPNAITGKKPASKVVLDGNPIDIPGLAVCLPQDGGVLILVGNPNSANATADLALGPPLEVRGATVTDGSGKGVGGGDQFGSTATATKTAAGYSIEGEGIGYDATNDSIPGMKFSIDVRCSS